MTRISSLRCRRVRWGSTTKRARCGSTMGSSRSATTRAKTPSARTRRSISRRRCTTSTSGASWEAATAEQRASRVCAGLSGDRVGDRRRAPGDGRLQSSPCVSLRRVESIAVNCD
eukprot:Amastigsp_a2803_52.p5 type:complete len:115 gc:universal Amastigsp_a2803_52:882-1226(+)